VLALVWLSKAHHLGQRGFVLFTISEFFLGEELQMEFNAMIQKSNRVKPFLLLMKKKHLANNKGAIPVLILIIITIVAVLGVGTIGFLLGKGYSFSIGIAIGIGLIIILPNLDRIIRWFKSVKGEIKK